MGWDELMETLKKRFEEQKERHEGGSKMDRHRRHQPFGAYGYNPQGIRIGQDKGRNRSAVKVWDQRQYKDYDDSLELGTRNIKVALRRLRRFAREGCRRNSTSTTRSTRPPPTPAGSTSRWCPSGTTTVKVLLLMDVGGTMDEHIHRVESCSSRRRASSSTSSSTTSTTASRLHLEEQPAPLQREVPTWDLIRKLQQDYKLIFVGDATMSRYEILQPGGSVGYNNRKPAPVAAAADARLPSSPGSAPEPQGVGLPAEHLDRPAAGEDQRMFALALPGLEDDAAAEP